MGNRDKRYKEKYADLNKLVEQAMRGDAGAFGRLCEAEAAQVIYFCTKLMGNLQDGEDAAQEVFICMQKKLTSLQMPQMYTAWVQKIIHNVCGTMRRNRMKYSNAVPVEELADLFVEEDSGVVPEEYLHNREKSGELMRVIDGLPQQVRACILMHYFKDMKIADISDVLQVSEGSVKGYLYVGREKIRKAIREDGTEGQLLPMSAIAVLLHNDMRDTVTPEMVRECLDAAGIKLPFATSIKGGVSAKSMFIAALCTGMAIATLVVYLTVASPQPAGAPAQNDDPQRYFGAQAGWSEDMATNQDAASPEPAAPGSRPNEPGGGAPDENAPEAQPWADVEQGGVIKQPGAPAGGAEEQAQLPETRVAGAVVLQDADTAEVFGEQYYVTLSRDGRQIAMAMVAADGSFVFEGLELGKGGLHTVQVHPVHNYGLVLAGGDMAGIWLTPGKAHTLEKPFVATDDEKPVVAVEMLDDKGQITVADPANIYVRVADATQTATSWEIYSGGDLAQAGEGERISTEALGRLAAGRYTLNVITRDAAGNETAVERVFYIR